MTGDIDDMAFNTAISQLMVYSNHLQTLETAKALPAEPVRTLALLLSPFAPHLGEEIWQMLGGEGSLAYAPWPEYDEALCVEDEVTLAVQINGKKRAMVVTSKTAAEDEVSSPQPETLTLILTLALTLALTLTLTLALALALTLTRSRRPSSRCRRSTSGWAARSSRSLSTSPAGSSTSSSASERARAQVQRAL